MSGVRPTNNSRLLVDVDHEDFIADIPSGAVGAIAVAEETALWMKDPDMDPADVFHRMLRKCKHLSASRDGRGRDDLVEVNRAKQDPRLPPEYGMVPRLSDANAQPVPKEALGAPRTP